MSNISSRISFVVNGRRCGFTLIEIMIVVVMIGLLAAMSTPAFQRVRQNSQNTVFINDVRVYAGLFDTYIAENGTLPESAAPGTIPTGFETYLKTEPWFDGPSIGGAWDVEKDVSGIRYAVGARGYTAPDDQLLKLDRDYDDGSLSTGNYRKLGSDGYYYIVAE